MARYYEIRCTVGYEETNFVGNVYCVNHPRWRGHRRERLLTARRPDPAVARSRSRMGG